MSSLFRPSTVQAAAHKMAISFFFFLIVQLPDITVLTGQTSCGKTVFFQFLFHFYDASSPPFPFNPPSCLPSYLTYFPKDIKPPIKVHNTISLTPRPQPWFPQHFPVLPPPPPHPLPLKPWFPPFQHFPVLPTLPA